MIKHITTFSMFRSGHNFVLQNVLSWFEDGDRYVHHNLENVMPRKIMPNHLNYPGYKLLIYRDFDDWLASVIAKCYRDRPTRHADDIPNFLDNVCQLYWMVREEIGKKEVYKYWIVIHYDKFVESEKYRRNICHLLSGIYSEEKIDHVPPNGHHSSFDGKKYISSGSQMNVLNRSKDILKTEHKELYLKLMKKYDK